MANLADADRWRTLSEFVARWYSEPLQAKEHGAAQLDGVGPPALREWFSLVDGRLKTDADGSSAVGTVYPRRALFAAWPAVPEEEALSASDLLPVIGDGEGVASWGIRCEDAGDDPPVYPLGESPPFAGSLSALLTQELILDTVIDDAPRRSVLGRLRPGLRRLKYFELTATAVAFLESDRFAPLPGGSLERGVRSDPEHTLLVCGRGDYVHVLAASQEALQPLLELNAQHRAGQEERRAQERAAKAEQVAQADWTGPDLVAALEGIEDRLLRFQRVFLEDLRRHVSADTATPEMLLKAAKILEDRRP